MQVDRMDGYIFPFEMDENSICPHPTNVFPLIPNRTQLSVALTLEKKCGLDSSKYGLAVKHRMQCAFPTVLRVPVWWLRYSCTLSDAIAYV
ncbi:hypothetical protein TNCV_2299631 [Trichonephila clavipes]|nr:hypothetical protein TNCV_2299631 [Trichonephila clavipes]